MKCGAGSANGQEGDVAPLDHASNSDAGPVDSGRRRTPNRSDFAFRARATYTCRWRNGQRALVSTSEAKRER